MNRRKFIGLSSLAIPTFGLAQKITESKEGIEPTKNNATEVIVPIYPEFDLYTIPFSSKGSYHTISKKQNTKNSRLVINTVRRSAISHKWYSTWTHNLLEIALFRNGNEIEFSTKAEPWALQLSANEASASIVFADNDTLVIHTNNCSLHLIPVRNFSWKYQLNKGRYAIYDGQSEHYHYIQTYNQHSATFGKTSINNSKEQIDTIEFDEDGENTILLKMITEEQDFNPVLLDYKTLVKQKKSEVETWMTKTPKALKEHESAVKTGWFLFWNLQVAPWKNYSRQTVLSSKKSMSMIWSWDICFNALALVKADYVLAWDQLFAILDKQKENGLLPDAVNDLQSNYGFNKPPVWGWTIMKMLEQTPQHAWTKLLREAYPKVSKFNTWWFTNRTINKQGICAYMHGNDSGWDNATIFDERVPVESPDLTAFLILETEALVFMANHLGFHDEAIKHAELAKQQLQLFEKTFINSSGFAVRSLTPQGIKEITSTSLLSRIPLILGSKKLSPDTITTVVKELKEEGNFLTKNGIASESLKSIKYEKNGYWRGPIWAPSTYLIFDALLACGEKKLARTIAKRFCDMVSKKATFHENYDAVTGEGLYDSGLTWTASDFLMMAEWLAENG